MPTEIKTPDGSVIQLSDWREQSTYSTWLCKDRYVDVWLTSGPNGSFLEIYQRRRVWCWPFRRYEYQRVWWVRRWKSECLKRWPVPPGWSPTEAPL